MSKGYVYILSNEFMPGLVKIGMTTRSVRDRANELFQTGVPTPFKVEGEMFSPDCADMERAAHQEFSEHRVADDREFFRVGPSVVEDFLYQYLEEQVRDLISEYLPDYSLAEPDMFIDPSAIAIIALVTGVATPDVVQIIEQIRCDDNAFDFEVLRDRLDARRARVKAARTQKAADEGVVLQ